MEFSSRTPLFSGARGSRYASVSPSSAIASNVPTTSRSSRALSELDADMMASSSLVKRIPQGGAGFLGSTTRPLAGRSNRPTVDWQSRPPGLPVVSATTGPDIRIGDEHDAFAILLESADMNQDELAILKSFQALCDATIKRLNDFADVDQSRIRAHKEEIHMWTLEKHTWDLVQRLLELRLSQIDETDLEQAEQVHAYSGDWKLAQRASTLNRQLQEHLLVISWLESIAPPYQGIDAHLSNTALDMVITQMDPDAPSRQKRKLVEDDEAYQEDFNKAIFEHIRRGERERAWELSDASGHFWKTASLLGATHYRDSMLDEFGEMEDPIDEGNQNRDLWKAVCYAIANDDSFDKYERALYAVMAGDLQNALPVCETWEDVVWLHYSVLVQGEIEDTLRRYPRAIGGDDTADDIITMRIPSEFKDPATIFSDLHNGSRPELREAANEQIRLLQSDFILDQLDEYLRKLLTLMQESDIRRSMSTTRHLPTMLRIAVHLVLILRTAERPVNDDVSDLLIKRYIQMLIAGRRNKHIALFTRSLPREDQIVVYSHFLADSMESREVRHQYFRQVFQYGLDCHEICRQTVKIVFERGILRDAIPPNAQAVQLIADLNASVTESDAVMIRALEWVAFEEQQRQDLVTYCNMLLRRLLVLGRMNAAKSVVKFIPSHVIPPQWGTRHVGGQLPSDGGDRVKTKNEVLAEEYFQYFLLLEVYSLYGEWVSEYNRLPITDGYLNKVTKDLETKIMILVDTEWFLIDDETGINFSEDVKAEFRLLRDLYIPEVVIMLHRILFDTRNIEAGNLDKSLRIAELVARRDGPWKEMRRSGKLDAFMQLLRQSALNALGSNATTPWSSPRTV